MLEFKRVSRTQKTIVIDPIASTMLYVVPVDRKFEGQAIGFGNIHIVINGKIVASSSTSLPYALNLKLKSGDIVSCGATHISWTLIGQES
jgi:hypothetical protein